MKKIFFLLSILFLLSCSEELKKPSEDSEIALESFSLAEKLRTSYVKKDFESMQSYSTGAGYEEIKKELTEFERVELTFTPRLVEIEGVKVTLNVSWIGKWKLNGTTREGKGMAVFELTGKPLKLNHIIRANPFRVPD